MKKGILYIVATPIGNRDDFSPRAVEILRQVAMIAAEDTRHSRPLLQHYGISTPLTAFHEHNERQVMSRILGRLDEGESVAVISDAGTPLISDPGFPLVRECHMKGIRVSPVPGPSAAVCALSA
ncbi:MAG: ribosomal RNA small subunit methyltransferase I, partial [Sedimenticola sp.]